MQASMGLSYLSSITSHFSIYFLLRDSEYDMPCSTVVERCQRIRKHCQRIRK